MLDEHYPEAIKVRLIMDNLNTHNVASPYETFDPEEAQRLASRLEIHHTPKHSHHERRGTGMENPAQQQRQKNSLAIYNGRCQDKTTKPLYEDLSVITY